jgi:hypothetical protein
LAVNVLPKKIEVVGYSGYKANERPLYGGMAWSMIISR